MKATNVRVKTSAENSGIGASSDSQRDVCAEVGCADWRERKTGQRGTRVVGESAIVSWSRISHKPKSRDAARAENISKNPGRAARTSILL